ncbi:MAG: DUF2339 domain-containing protein, partial [Deinococcus sp.]|nr:DUF2339 domain-containing protein [Deinococcus sp.]
MELSLLLLVLIILAFPIYVLVRLARLGREVEDLKHRLEHLKHRLEQRLTQPAPTPAPERAPAVSPPPPVVPPPTPVIPPQPPERPQQVQPEAVPRPAPPPPPAPPPRPALAARKWDLETLLGANWMAKLGVAAIVLAVGFFLQYAFKSGLIGPRERVIGGLVVALAMLGGGQYLLPKRPYRGYAQVLASGGIAVFFL